MIAFMQKLSSNNVIGPDRLTRYVLDKTYDSEDIHERVWDTLNSCSLIPIRNRRRKRISGYYGRQMARSFDDAKYHQRNNIETAFSALKRKFGDVLKTHL
jgi:hypothetical protein